MESNDSTPILGSATAEEIYSAAGVAMSWWEGSEDMLMGLFRLLCAEREPSAFEVYVEAPRRIRNQMLKSALKRFSERFQGDEIERVTGAMKALDKLASVRNEIAHGHCSKTERKKDNVITMSGFFLLPSLTESGWTEIGNPPRFAHNAATMNAFTTAVREHRGIVMDVQVAIQLRFQAVHQRLSREAQLTIGLAKAVANGQIKPEDVLSHLIRVTPQA